MALGAAGGAGPGASSGDEPAAAQLPRRPAPAAPAGTLYGLLVDAGGEGGRMPSNEALAVYRALLGQKGAGYAETRLVPLVGPAATRAAVREQLRGLARRAGPGDTLLVYLAGEGVTRAGPGRAFVFHCAGGEPGLAGGELLGELAGCRGRVAVLADAGHAGGLLDDLRQVRFSRPEGPLLLLACGRDEEAHASGEPRRGLLTQALLRALTPGSAADANDDGVLDAGELAVFVGRQVGLLAEQARDGDGRPARQSAGVRLPAKASWPLFRVLPSAAGR
jgi:hypothetical protein